VRYLHKIRTVTRKSPIRPLKINSHIAAFPRFGPIVRSLCS
jgi:hypothetical protein